MAERLEILITASDQASSVFRKIGDTLGSAFKVGLAGATAGLALFTTGLGISINEAMDAEVNLAKFNAVLKSTGGVAGVTTDEATALADSLSKVTRFSDDTILSAESMLLTFTKISDKIFPDVTEMALDMAEMFGGVENATLQLGKAFNAPAEQAGALRRMGVALTDQQIEQMKAFEEAGDIYSSQQVLLKELQKEFGGVARALGQTTSGKLTIFKNQMLNIAEGLGMVLLPILTNVGMAIADKLIPFFEQLALVVGNFFEVLAMGDIALIKEGLGWLLGNEDLSFEIADFIVDLAQGFKNLFDIFSEFGVSGVFTLQFWMELNNIFGSEWGNRIREIAVSFGELYLKVSDLVERVIVPFVQEHSQIFINVFERLGMVLAGGLGIALVTGLISGLGVVIGAILSPIGLVIGAVAALSLAYDTNFLGMKDAVDAFAAWFTGTAMPAVINFITSDVLPALKDLYDWFVTDALPAIIDFVTTDFIPFTLDLWAAIKDIWDKVKGPLGELFTWFVEDALPAIVEFIVKDAIPFIQDLWKELQKIWDEVEPQLTKLSNWFRVEAIPAILNIINNVVIPAFNALRTGISNLWDIAGPKLTSFFNFMNDKIGWLKVNVIDPLVSAVQSLVDWIGKIQWPDVPPWAQGLISTAGDLVGRQHGGPIQGFGIAGEAGRELVYAPQGAYVFPNGITEQIVNNFNLSVNSQQSLGTVQQDFRLMEAWGS